MQQQHEQQQLRAKVASAESELGQAARREVDALHWARSEAEARLAAEGLARSEAQGRQRVTSKLSRGRACMQSGGWRGVEFAMNESRNRCFAIASTGEET